MFKTTNIASLGAEYNIDDENGNFIKTVQVIPYVDILNAAVGPFNDDFADYEEYIAASLSVLSGFETIDPDTVLWYATSKAEISVSEILEYALVNGYETIILEYLEELE